MRFPNAELRNTYPAKTDSQIGTNAKRFPQLYFFFVTHNLY